VKGPNPVVITVFICGNMWSNKIKFMPHRLQSYV
jgi:hypothetical protein